MQNDVKKDIFEVISDTRIYEKAYVYLEYLLQSGVNPNKGLIYDFLTPLMYAVTENNLHAAWLLLEYGADVNAVTTHDGTALRIAVILGYEEMAALLLQYGADVNFITDGMTNLEAAISSSSPRKSLIKLLAYCGGKINLDRISLLYDSRNDEGLILLNTYVPAYFWEDVQFVILLLQLNSICKK